MTFLTTVLRVWAAAASAVAGFLVLVTAPPAYANTTFADCAALDGHVFVRASNSAIISENNTITTLNDGDVISFTVVYSSGANGTVTGTIDIDGATIFSETLTFGGGGLALGVFFTRNVSYDPPGDGTNVPLVFTTLPFSSAEGTLRILASCTPGAASSVPTQPASVAAAATKTFAIERARRILEERPDRPRYIRKRLQALWGDDADTSQTADTLTRAANGQQSRATPPSPINTQQPFQVASTNDGSSLAGMSARDATLRAYSYRSDDVTEGCGADDAGASRLSCVDVWTEGHYTRFTDRGDRDGHFAVVYAGADIHLTPWIIAGLMGQVDWMVDDINSANTRVEGIGWMAGPYLSARLTPELFVDVRAAWGLSDTDVNAAGVTGNVSTERWLVTGQLSGNFHAGSYRITPEVSVEYIREKLDAYTVSSGAQIAAQTVSIGRLRAGPEIARIFDIGNGATLEPRVAVAAIWDFNPADSVTLGGVRYGDDELRAVVEAGTILKTESGINFAISGKYEGLGVAGFDAYGGYLWINIPI
ncbi:possible Bacterial Ig-like domain (group 1) [Candidatus Phaeomarinobacter ectocarpi]|uniref:Possible Bacterial Ig-like domain (Group 1) n=1 Tax=Candidatus Phaeomarinibacter ectocarpi TaxID=1458461 RepID=X5MH97_9HYPH|nr:autotransporter outer membrane beta-barrel domain-containing protein [Candidatus Phaeomarinobacter ectocarpi]CDO61034.1 possible Bacterial Ig-like domain (group 1) [Candidatus Phaeomarinobacter ectocarpi]